MHPALLAAFAHPGVVVAGGFHYPPQFVSHDLALQAAGTQAKFARVEFAKDEPPRLAFKHDPLGIDALYARFPGALGPPTSKASPSEKSEQWTAVAAEGDDARLHACLEHAHAFALSKLSKPKRAAVEALRGERNHYPDFVALAGELATRHPPVTLRLDNGPPMIHCGHDAIAKFEGNLLFLMQSQWTAHASGHADPSAWAALLEPLVVAARQRQEAADARYAADAERERLAPKVPVRVLTGQVDIAHGTLTGASIVPDRKSKQTHYIRDVQLVDCELVTHSPGSGLVLSRVRMEGGSFRQGVALRSKMYRDCHFERVAFSGRFDGCDFGDRDPVDGSATACDFTQARLLGCRIGSADVDGNRFAAWPTFVMKPGTFAVDQPGISASLQQWLRGADDYDSDPKFAAMVYDAEELARKEGIDLDELVALLQRLGVIAA